MVLRKSISWKRKKKKKRYVKEHSERESESQLAA